MKKLTNRVISDVHFDTVDEGYIEVWVVSDCDGAEDTELLFSFFEDELSFSTEDFIGKTVREAIDIFEEKTKAYLLS